jgi:hypothetical protein
MNLEINVMKNTNEVDKVSFHKDVNPAGAQPAEWWLKNMLTLLQSKRKVSDYRASVSDNGETTFILIKRRKRKKQ